LKAIVGGQYAKEQRDRDSKQMEESHLEFLCNKTTSNAGRDATFAP
jgi:hypothetical protein